MSSFMHLFKGETGLSERVHALGRVGPEVHETGVGLKDPLKTSLEIRAMKAASRFDSKNPLEGFKKDSGAKQRAAGPCLRTLVSRDGLWAAYVALDRKGQHATL